MKKIFLLLLFPFSLMSQSLKDSTITAIESDKNFYPNPTKGILFVDGLKEFQITNQLGISIKRSSINNQLDISDFDEGIYFIDRKRILLKK